MKRAKVEYAIAVVFLASTILTAITPSWIEELTGFEPDGGNGALEWLIVGLFGLVALAFALSGRKHQRAAHIALEGA